MTAQETNLLNAFETTLTGTIGASDLTFTVNSVVDSASNTLAAPCYLVLNPDSATNREVVLVTSINVGTKTLTLDNINKRYLTGSAATSGLSHASGSVVRMSPLQQHIEDLNDRVDELPTNSSTDTLTNKTIDADNNTISNLEVDNLKSGVLDTDLSSTAGTDTTLPSAKAVKTYVDAQTTAQDLDATADSGGPISIDLDSEVLDIAGGTGIDTTASGNEISIAIDSTVVTESSTDTLTNKTINLENNTAIVVYVVTVAGGKFVIDGESQATISFRPGVVHRFDLSDSTTALHPFVLSETSEGTAYTTGRTASGSQGSANAYIEFTVDADTPDNLYYYCSSHSGMGGKIGVFGSTLEGGDGLTITGNSIAVDIPNLSNEGTADNNDIIMIYDDTGSALKKQTRAAFLTGTGVGNMNSFTISDGATSQTISDGNTITFSGTSNEVEVAVSATDTVTIGLPASITANVTGNVTGNVSGTSGSTTGNAATATALETARNIGGVSFDGTGNIDLPGVNTAGNQATSGNAATATALATARNIAGQSFDGTANITIAAGDLSNVSTSGVSDGQVLVYNNSASEFQPGSVGSATALIDGDSDFTLSDGIANGIHYELDNTDMADWNQAGVVLSTAGGIFQHHQTQAATYSVPASTGAVLAGPITITGTITNNGTMVVI
tara:strand:- start:26 stop:2038 length:2013 start_codon:yes stop_codon:yes gene_type:complete